MKSFRWDANANCMHCDENLSSYAGSAQIGCLIIKHQVSYQSSVRWELIQLFMKIIAHHGLLELPPLTLFKLLTPLKPLTLNFLLMQNLLKLAVSLSSTGFQISQMIIHRRALHQSALKSVRKWKGELLLQNSQNIKACLGVQEWFWMFYKIKIFEESILTGQTPSRPQQFDEFLETFRNVEQLTTQNLQNAIKYNYRQQNRH